MLRLALRCLSSGGREKAQSMGRAMGTLGSSAQIDGDRMERVTNVRRVIVTMQREPEGEGAVPIVV